MHASVILSIKLYITFCVLEIVSPEGNNHLLSSSFVAPIWRQTNAKKIIHLVSSQNTWLIAEQGTKAVWMPSDFVQNSERFQSFTESVEILCT